jgi:hypothetical protein
MVSRRSVARFLTGPEEWNRRRLQILLGVAVLVVVAVAAGMVWSVIALLHGGPTEAASNDQDSPTSRTRDGSVPEAASVGAAEPGPLSAEHTGTIQLPQPATVGAAQVGTGLPRSVAGAIAQLVAIDQRAIGSASVVVAQDVITSWAAPGGPTSASWSGVEAVQTLLESAGLPANGAGGSGGLVVQLDPAMGLVRDSSDGSAGTTPGAAEVTAATAATVCVDFVLTATPDGGQPSQIAVADCQHMTWRDGRWIIGAGPEATATASLWPGTQVSYDAGYEWLEVRP